LDVETDASTPSPRIVFLRHTALKRHYFLELGIDLAAEFGPSLMYTTLPETCGTDTLKVLSGPTYSRQSEQSRLWSGVRYFIGAARLVATTPGRPLIFMVAQPPWLPLLGLAKKWLTGQRYVVWVDDVYPDALVAHRRLPADSPIVRIWARFNQLVLSRADRVFTIGACMAETVGRYLDSSRKGSSVVVVPTWVDSEAIRPLPKDRNPFAIEHGQLGKLTVLYSGNLGLSHDLDTVLEAALRLAGHPEVHFMIIGYGTRWESLQIAVAALETQNVSLLPFQPEEVLPYSLATGDVAVVSLDRGLEGISMPSKTYYAMAAGSALAGISVVPNDLEAIITRYRCGYNVAPGDVDGFVSGIMRFLEEPSFLAACRRNARVAVEHDLSRAVNACRVADEIRPLLQSLNVEG
jgi:glycosyltransferase involved in cell wall biosynthesis